jgi:protein-export membrane protein SecD
MLNFPRWKTALVLVASVLGVLFAIPNFLSPSTLNGLPSWLPKKQVSLGLDLQGGSHLLLEVDMATVIRERLNNALEGARTALRNARIGYTGLTVEGNRVLFQLRDLDRTNDIRQIVKDLDTDLDVEIGPNGAVSIGLNERAIAAKRRSAVDQSIEIIRRRIDETGTREPTIQRQGEDRILVQLPGIDNPERVKALLGRTAKMTFRLVDPTTSVEEARAGRLPPGSELLQGEARAGQQPERYVVRKRVMVSGDTLTDAQPTFQNNEPVVSFKFDAVGAKRFADATRENVGKPFAIVLDDKVISAPVIREPIVGGSGVISGSFTVQSAQDFALLLRAGALPAPLTVLEERTVGPDLGQDSIHAGAVASIVAVALVVVFMLVFYGLFGIFANIALFFNLAMLLSLLSLLGATLTLPGIAGIALTMGMAVDANVLIYERIREEVRNGRSILAAIDAGYQRAFGTILDSNVTTLLAGALLFWLGSGPVKGFAVTLSIGIMTSMFTALLITRLLIIWWLRRYKPKVIPI